MTVRPIRLRPWRFSDAADLVSIYASADDLARQFASPVGDLEAARHTIDTRLTCTDENVHAAIEVGGRAVGNVGITGIRRDGAHAGIGWVSYFVAADVRGQGLTGRACAALATWALTDLGLERLELGYRTNNPASAAVARRAGFVVEGLERQKLVYDGVRFDVELCARLVSDPAPEACGVLLDASLAPTR